MEYIQRIRARVGHEKILVPTNALVLLNQANEVLLHRRTDSGRWGLPGGIMDIGETAEESIRREAKEETGLSVGKIVLYGIFSGPKFEVKYPNGDETAPVVLAFYSSDYTGTITENSESHDVRFFSFKDLPEKLDLFHKRFIEGFLEFQNSGLTAPIIR